MGKKTLSHIVRVKQAALFIAEYPGRNIFPLVDRGL
jgi:hypothetical protein